MLSVTKGAAPPCLHRFAVYEDLRQSDCYRHVRTEIETDQDGACVYCERLFGAQHDRQSSIEHVRPQHPFQALQTSWPNLTGSCRAKAHCGNAKGSQWSSDFLDPVSDYPPAFIAMRPTTGQVEPQAGLCSHCRDRAMYTITILKLNHASLTEARRNSSKAASAALERGGLTIDEYLSGSPLDFPVHLRFSFKPAQKDGGSRDSCPGCGRQATRHSE